MKRATSLLGLSLAISCAPPPQTVTLAAPIAQPEEAPDPSSATTPGKPSPSPSALEPVAAPAPPLDAVRDLRFLSPRSRLLLVAEARYLESLFARMPARSPDRPQLIRRLADHYAELGVAALPQGGGITAAARARAILYYTMLLAQHPGWCASPGANAAAGCEDETLYHLGLEYERGGDTAKAWQTYFHLLHRHPRSSFAPSTYLAFGELEVATQDPSRLPLAEKAYQDALQYPPAANVVWGYAQYQLGRVRARLGNLAQAASSFRRVLVWAQSIPSVPAAAELAAAAQQELAVLKAP